MTRKIIKRTSLKLLHLTHIEKSSLMTKSPNMHIIYYLLFIYSINILFMYTKIILKELKIVANR